MNPTVSPAAGNAGAGHPRRRRGARGLLPWLRPDSERARAAVVAVVVVLMWRYMIWRWLATLPPIGLTHRLDRRACMFVIVETLAMMGTTIGLVVPDAAQQSLAAKWSAISAG